MSPDQAQLSLRAGKSCLGFETANDFDERESVAVGLLIRVKRDGQPNVKVARKTKAARHDSHDGVRSVVERERVFQDCFITCVAALPECFANDCNVIRASPVFFRQKETTTQWLHSQGREETGSHLCARDALRFAIAGEIKIVISKGGEVRETVALFPR